MNLFAVTGPFVPVNEPMALLPYKHLRCLDAEIKLICLSEKKDLSLLKNLENDSNYNKFEKIEVGKYSDALFSIKNVNLIKALYYKNRFVKKCEEHFLNGNYDVLYTSSFPAFCHEAGIKIKNKNDVLWIASFTDPINHNPYKYDKETYHNYMLIEKVAFHVYSYFYVPDWVEKETFENADLLIFICEEQRDFMIDQYITFYNNISKDELLEKSFIFPLTYIDEWGKNSLLESNEYNDKFVLSHFGRVYGLRKIEKFIYAVKELVEENKMLNDYLVIEQYGEFRTSDKELIAKLNLEHIFHLSDKIPYEECLKKMKNSNGLLIFDTILPEDSWQPFLPSKVLEYSLLQKNVLAITTKKSPVYRIMCKTNSLCAEYSVSDIKKELQELIEGKDSKIDYHYENKEIGFLLNNKINDLLCKRRYNNIELKEG